MKCIIFSISALVLLSNPAVAQNFVPPIGIPMPPFGISETHEMYTGQQYDFGSGPQAYPDAGNGPFTHYIDSAHPLATDDNNGFGSPDKPRLTIPHSVAPGSVVEIHHDILGNGFGVVVAGGEGTADRPIFFRGIGQPRAEKSLDIGYYTKASYLIFENLNLYAADILGFGDDTGEPPFTTRNVVFRNNEITGDLDGGGIGAFSYTSNEVRETVIYQNDIHDNGDVNATFDQDVHGIGIGQKTSDVWVLDNKMYRNSGDGIQINTGGGWTNGKGTGSNFYVGRNLAFANKQNGFWTKQATNVVFSQNTAHSHKPSDSSDGAGMGFQYGPANVWFLFNRIYNCFNGIASGSNSVDTAGLNSYYVGNLIYNIHDDSPNYQLSGGWGHAALRLVGGVNRFVVNNTIFDTDAGINMPSPGSYFYSGNIVGQVVQPEARHVFSEGLGSFFLENNLFFQPGGPARIEEEGTPVYNPGNLPASFGAGNLEANPLFVDTANANFTLAPGSGAIDGCVENQIYGAFFNEFVLDIRTDVFGNPRPAGTSGWDIGAIESGKLADADEETSPLNVAPIVSPNPVRDVLEVFSPGWAFEKMEIFDLNGRLLGTFGTARADVSGLPPGFYFLKISGSQKAVFFARFLKI